MNVLRRHLNQYQCPTNEETVLHKHHELGMLFVQRWLLSQNWHFDNLQNCDRDDNNVLNFLQIQLCWRNIEKVA